MYVLRLGFLEGGHGLVLSMLGAFSVYLKYARLWEMGIRGESVGVTARVEAAGPIVREQIGRMVDEESTRGRGLAAPVSSDAGSAPTRRR